MRRLLIACLVVASSLSFTVVLAEESPRVFMFVRDGSRDLDLMLEKEVGVMRQMLEEAGYAVDIATASGEAFVSDSMTLEPTVKLGDVDIADYAGVALPCMAPAAGYPVPAEVDAIVEQAVELGMPVAAARGSVVTLAKAGGLVGLEYSFAREPDIEKRPEFAGASYVDAGVTRSGVMATSKICPLAALESGQQDGTEELTRLFIESLPEAG